MITIAKQVKNAFALSKPHCSLEAKEEITGKMPTKIERLIFGRKKLTLELNRLHDTIIACNAESNIGLLVSYRQSLEVCWSKYSLNSEEIEGSRDFPCDDEYLTAEDMAQAKYTEARGHLLGITPNNDLHQTLVLFEQPGFGVRAPPRASTSTDDAEDGISRPIISEHGDGENDGNADGNAEGDVEDDAENEGSEIGDDFQSARNTFPDGPVLRRNGMTSTSTPDRTMLPMVPIKLPPLQIKKFSGDRLAWPEFKATCEATFAHIDPINRFRYLKFHLSGEAERLVMHLPISVSSYGSAWRILHRRYENERAVINANLTRLIELPQMHKESADSLKQLVDTTNECLAAVQSYGISTTSWSCILVLLLSRKLDNNSIKHWEEYIQGSRDVPLLDTFFHYLDMRINVLETVYSVNQAPKPVNSHPNVQQKPKQRVMLSTEPTQTCVFCQANHASHKCTILGEKPVAERRQLVKDSNLCFNCLQPHFIAACTQKTTCRVCKRKHHTLLHEYTAVNESTRRTNVSNPFSSTSNAFNGHVNERNVRVILATAMVQIKHAGKSMVVKALIDQGSMSNLVTKRVCDALQLPSHSVDVPISGVGGSITCKIKKRTKFELSPYFESGENLRLDALIMPKITTLSLVPKSDKWQHIKDVQLADPNIDKNGRIDILIGASTFSEILLEGIRRGGASQPMAQNTKLGWILSGKASVGHTKIIPIMTVNIGENDDALLHSIKQFWEAEEIPIQKQMSPDEVRAEEIYAQTTKRCQDGRYMVKLPFKSEPTQTIGESLGIAKKRLSNSLARLNKRPEFKVKYDACVQEYLDLNHMEIVDMHQKPYYYLPHHAVIRESSTTTKIRPVFDASCKTLNGNSLNSELIVGPTIQPDLFSLLTHWRKYEYAITGDIEKMYRQVWVYPDDTQFQRILWQPPGTSAINSYRLKTVTFGVASAPFLAIRTLYQIGEDIKYDKPDLAAKIQTQFYVDDYLDSCTSEAEARRVLLDITDEMTKFGMKLRKWKSNAESVLESLPPSEKEEQENHSTTFKTLGIQWQPSTDMFVFLPMELNEKIGLSKRSILSDISKLFDPLGWLSPCIILAKAFMQRLWLLNLDWDTQIPDEHVKEWLIIRNQFQSSCAVKIPRWIGLSADMNDISMHGFSDASETAYACVVYVRIKQPDNTFKCNLIAAKTRVAPLSNVSIPKLELNGSLLLVKLMRKIVEALRIPYIEQVAWTDSHIVLCWLANHPSKWKTYVANRVAKIQELHPTNQWRHVGSKLNPADCASRGLIRNELEKFDLWWKGPGFLTQDHTHWPSITFKSTNLEEKKAKKLVCLFEINEDSFIHRFSSYNRMLRVAMNCFKWLNKVKGAEAFSLCEVENRLIRLVQAASFEEIHALENKKPISNKSPIRNLDPFIDKNGILRVGGRLHQSSLTENEKHPIILPAKHHFTTILIRQTHESEKHGGLAITLQKLRQRFWIVNAKTYTNTIIRHCVICFRFRTKPLEQRMGNLPKYRLNQAIPFTYTGVDYAGYFNIKSSQRKNAPFTKAYVSLFICLTTRAVHLELVSDLSSEQFLKAFKRFVSRRGIPSDMYSDNGTNFIKAAKELNIMFEASITQNHTNNESFVSWLQSNRIKWTNIPPHAPHFGGWESGVKLMKHHLKRTLGDVRLTFEDFNTLIIEIEAIVNSRPLWSIPSKTDEFEPLTPGHFLAFKPLNAIPEPDLSHIAINRLNQYQYLCRLVADFWKLWSKEYVQQFHKRNKWKDAKPNIKPNQIVLIMEDNEAPTQWSLGKVAKVIEGKDGLVRVVKLVVHKHDNQKEGCSTKFIERSIHRLSLLPIEDNSTIN